MAAPRQFLTADPQQPAAAGQPPVGFFLSQLAAAALVSVVLFPQIMLAAEIDEVVVTGIREQALFRTPRSVSLIGATDLDSVPSRSLADLLAREANVTLRSFTGTDKFAGVDIRGMGDTHVSNVLVLVDGVRLNSPDLAGPDLASIPLSGIERVEVVRGANAVRYGDGAVGGVINVVTMRPSPGLQTGASARRGSFDRSEADGSITGRGARFEAGARGSFSDTDGYRENGGLTRRTLMLDAGWRDAGRLAVAGSALLYDDDYGLPGPVSAESFGGTSDERRASRAPDDGGSTRDHRYRLALTRGACDEACLEVSGTWRTRRNDFVIGFTPLLPREEQLTRIDEDTGGAELRGSMTRREWSLAPEFDVGLGIQDADYRREPADRSDPAADGSLTGLFGFAAVRLDLPGGWGMSLGHREHQSRLSFSRDRVVAVCEFEQIPGLPVQVPVNCVDEVQRSGQRNERWRLRASELALTWQPAEQVLVYASASSAFRSPNLDEIAQSPEGLRPQRSTHIDAGLRWHVPGAWRLSVASFTQTTHDEILFGLDALTGENLNLNVPDTTRRIGAEIDFSAPFARQWEAAANAGYVRARIASSGAPVPLVPAWTAGGSLTWRSEGSLTGVLAARYTGSRTDGNDFGETRQFARLDGFTVVDLTLLWELAGLGWSFGIANLFDKVAAASAYSGTLYPLAERSFLVGLRWPAQSR